MILICLLSSVLCTEIVLVCILMLSLRVRCEMERMEVFGDLKEHLKVGGVGGQKEGQEDVDNKGVIAFNLLDVSMV